jgi:hypothetical protein
VSKHFLNCNITWRDLELAACACAFIISIACLVLIYYIINRSCAEIFLSGDDCGVGIGWFVMAVAVVGTGIYSAWLLYLMEKERACSKNPVSYKKE